VHCEETAVQAKCSRTRKELMLEASLHCRAVLRELYAKFCVGVCQDSWAENFWRAQGCSAVRLNSANRCSRTKFRIVVAFRGNPLTTRAPRRMVSANIRTFRPSKKIKPKA
jgi:hypothetical protein